MLCILAVHIVKQNMPRRGVKRKTPKNTSDLKNTEGFRFTDPSKTDESEKAGSKTESDIDRAKLQPIPEEGGDGVDDTSHKDISEYISNADLKQALDERLRRTQKLLNDTNKHNNETNEKRNRVSNEVIKALQDEIRKLTDDKSAVESEISKIKSEAAAAHAKIEKSNSKIKSEAAAAHAKIEKSDSVIQKQKERNKALKDAKEKIENEYKHLGVNNNFLTKTLEKATEQIKELDTINKQLSGRCKEFEQKLLTLAEKQSLEQEQKTKIGELKETKKRLESLQKSLKRENTSLTSENNFLNNVDSARIKKAKDDGYKQGIQYQMLENGANQIERRMKYNRDDHIVKSMKKMVEQMKEFNKSGITESNEILQFFATAEQLKILFEMHFDMEQFSESGAARLLHEMVDDVLLPFFLCWRRFYATDTMQSSEEDFVDDACEEMMTTITQSKPDMLCKQVILLGKSVEAYVLSANNTDNKSNKVHKYTVERSSMPDFSELEEWLKLAATHALKKHSLQDKFEASVGKIEHLANGNFEVPVTVHMKVHHDSFSRTSSSSAAYHTPGDRSETDSFKYFSDISRSALDSDKFMPHGEFGSDTASSTSSDVMATAGSGEVQRCNECIDFLEHAHGQITDALKDIHLDKKVQPWREKYKKSANFDLNKAWFFALEQFQLVCGYLLKQATVLSAINRKDFRLFLHLNYYSPI